jgi:hypothetical protein
VDNKNREIHYYPHSEEARKIHQSPARFRVVDCGRRFGKTVLAVAEIWQCVMDVRKEFGRKARGWWVAPTYDLCMEGKRYMEPILNEVIMHRNGKLAINEKRCLFFEGSEVEFKSTDSKDERLRGAGLDFVIVDEASRVSKEAWELGIRAAISDRQGRVLFLSTPKGRNWFYDIYVKGQDRKANPDYESWKIPTLLNPYFPRLEWEDLKKTQPEHIFRQEYLAEFLEDSSSVFRKIGQCVYGVFEEPKFGHEYVLGVDLAKVHDFTVIVVVDISVRPCHVVHFERFNQIEWTLQKEKIRHCAKTYNDGRVYIDSTGSIADAFEVDLRRSGVTCFGVHITNERKAEMVERGIIFIERRLITFPQIDELINELMAFEYEILPLSRKFRYQAPSGLFDDCVIAFCLALIAVQALVYEKAPAIRDIDEENKLKKLPDDERDRILTVRSSIDRTHRSLSRESFADQVSIL